MPRGPKYLAVFQCLLNGGELILSDRNRYRVQDGVIVVQGTVFDDNGVPARSWVEDQNDSFLSALDNTSGDFLKGQIVSNNQLIAAHVDNTKPGDPMRIDPQARVGEAVMSF